MNDVITIVLAAGTALGSAICFQFRVGQRQAREITEISLRLGRMEGEKEGVERLAKDTLDVVHKALEKRDKEE